MSVTEVRLLRWEKNFFKSMRPGDVVRLIFLDSAKSQFFFNGTVRKLTLKNGVFLTQIFGKSNS